MGSKGTADHRARQREAERRRRQSPKREPKAGNASGSAPDEASGPLRRAAAVDCAWCGGPITPGRRGPIPKWCSATCRHRAWEQKRAAASGRSAIEVVERRVEVPVPATPSRREWAGLLDELARQVEDGRIYDRDLLELFEALGAVLEALRRRPYVRSGALEDLRRAHARRQAHRAPW